jgi:hypothetical protein
MYEIISPRVGEPGAIFEPRPGVNVEALLAGGFIKQSTKGTVKSAKNKTEPDTEPESTED